MKKVAFMFVCMFAVVNMTLADDDRPIQVEQLPKTAQAFIKQHFADSPVALTKMERDIFGRNYDVIFTDGNKVDFNRKGEWIEVDCRHSQVPEAIIPAPIKEYVAKQYPNTKILKIEKGERGGYEVSLSNKWEISFDKRFNLIDIDD